jgi:hypothetical protein
MSGDVAIVIVMLIVFPPLALIVRWSKRQHRAYWERRRAEDREYDSKLRKLQRASIVNRKS